MSLPPPPPSDLPPVQPPSGRFIVQLFLVPGLIVFVIVLFLVGSFFIFTSGQTPTQILRRLDSDNSDIRWRAASDLAKTLSNQQSVALRTDPAFALDLCDRLDKALFALETEEKKVAKPGTDDNAFRALQPQRWFVDFLTGAVSSLDIAVGVPLLGEMALADKSPDIPNQAIRRRTAVSRLARLGSQLKEFDKLKPEQKQLIISKLRTEAESAEGMRRKAAQTALFYAGALNGIDPDVVHADDILAKTAKSDDELVRYPTAFALNFWDGPKTESTLVHLLDDRGQGTVVRAPIEP